MSRRWRAGREGTPTLKVIHHEAEPSEASGSVLDKIVREAARQMWRDRHLTGTAEPQRREILVLLRAGERPVTELARELGMTQPGTSKHLRVLREVGLVRERKD